MRECTPITAPAAPLDPTSGELVDGSLSAEAEQCLRNIAAVCDAAGASLERTLRTTVLTTDLEVDAIVAVD
jgi:2-iminobutanoate/2-iminopropanoate deaminase